MKFQRAILTTSLSGWYQSLSALPAASDVSTLAQCLMNVNGEISFFWHPVRESNSATKIWSSRRQPWNITGCFVFCISLAPLSNCSGQFRFTFRLGSFIEHVLKKSSPLFWRGLAFIRLFYDPTNYTPSIGFNLNPATAR